MRAPILLTCLLLATASMPLATALLGEETLDADAELLGVTAAVVVGGHFLVGYKEGQQDSALLSIQLAGGTVERVHEKLRIALVNATDADAFTATILLSPGVDWVETEDDTRLSGAQWNGAQWNGAEWNGAQWNGAQWNGAQWNAVHGTPTKVNDPGRFKQWGLVSANVSSAWQTSTGSQAANLCVIDSGVDSDHGDIAPNLWRNAEGAFGYNAIDPSLPPEDDAGHGTHMAGIAAGVIGNDWGIAGIGNVRIMSVKVLDSEGRGSESDLAWGIAWCADNGADVALMALSASDPGPALDRAIAYAHARDVTLVASSGNGGCDGCVAYPARHPLVIGVSAINSQHNVANFTSRGPEVALAAPGVDILSTFYDSKFAYGSGTSQAAAHAAGAAALLRDAHPDLNTQSTRDALTGAARDAGPAGRDNAYGYGLLDIGGAMQRANSNP